MGDLEKRWAREWERVRLNSATFCKSKMKAKDTNELIHCSLAKIACTVGYKQRLEWKKQCSNESMIVIKEKFVQVQKYCHMPNSAQY